MSGRYSLSKREQHKLIVKDFMRIHKTTEVDPDRLTTWAIETKRMEKDQSSFFRRCKKTLLKAMKDLHFTDDKGREVPVMIAIRKKDQKSIWVKLLDAIPKQVRIGLSQQRRSILAWCQKHSNTLDSYNDFNKHGGHVDPFDYNFNIDMKEKQLPIEYPDDPPKSE